MGPPRGVDHLIRVVPDLGAGMDEIERLLGVRPVVGGRHADLGSHNALLSLGGETYLEIMAADPALSRPERGRLFGLDDLVTPRLAAWVLRSEGIDAAAAKAKAGGLDLGPVLTGSREKPDGTCVTWKITDPYASRLDGAAPFLIAWGDSPHPALAAPAGAVLSGLRIEHPEPAAVERALRLLGVTMAVSRAPQAGLVASIRGPAGDVELR